MEYIIERWVEYNPETKTRSYHPWYLGKDIWGGRLVEVMMFHEGKIPFYLGIAYTRLEMDALVMYPKPLHLIARLIHRSYWRFLRVF